MPIKFVTKIPAPKEVGRIAVFLREHPQWSAAWDKHLGVWRVAEDDPDSDLHDESSEVDKVIRFMTAHS
jgi:hypothetical protein